MVDARGFFEKFDFVRNIMRPDKKLFSIGEMAKSINITRKIILNYETKELITPDVKEGPNGNRYYSIDTSFEQILKKYRWTKYRLSKESKLPESTLSNIFHHGTIPIIATLRTICETINLTLLTSFRMMKR